MSLVDELAYEAGTQVPADPRHCDDRLGPHTAFGHAMRKPIVLVLLLCCAALACDVPTQVVPDTASSAQPVCDSTRRMKLIELGQTVRMIELRANPLERGETAVFVVEGAQQIPSDAKLMWVVPIPSDGSSLQREWTDWHPMANSRYISAEVPDLSPGYLIVQLGVTETCTCPQEGTS